MLAVAFDTLKLARKLESAGFAPKQAQDTSAALAETFSEWQTAIDLATREDVRKSEAAVREDVHKSEAAVREDVRKVENRISGTENRISETKAEILKWFLGTVALQTLAVIGAVAGLLNHIGK